MKLITDINEYERLFDKLKYSVIIKNRKEYSLLYDCINDFKSNYGFIEIISDETYKFKCDDDQDINYLKLRYPETFYLK